MGGYRDWDDGDWPPARPRRVEGGIKARSRRGQIGESWWSGRFVAILESLGMGPRLGRGRAYARAGQVLDLGVAAGTASARVQGSRARPYRVSIGLARFAEADWARVESALAARAVYSAKLLAGEMPREIEEVFASCGLSLFPERARDLAMSCSCPDWAVPCKHIAATFYLLAEAFDADPFLILAWRARAPGRRSRRAGAPARPVPHRAAGSRPRRAAGVRLPRHGGVRAPWRRSRGGVMKRTDALVGAFEDTVPSPDRGNHRSTRENRAAKRRSCCTCGLSCSRSPSRTSAVAEAVDAFVAYQPEENLPDPVAAVQAPGADGGGPGAGGGRRGGQGRLGHGPPGAAVAGLRGSARRWRHDPCRALAGVG